MYFFYPAIFISTSTFPIPTTWKPPWNFPLKHTVDTSLSQLTNHQNPNTKTNETPRPPPNPPRANPKVHESSRPPPTFDSFFSFSCISCLLLPIKLSIYSPHALYIFSVRMDGYLPLVKYVRRLDIYIYMR